MPLPRLAAHSGNPGEHWRIWSFGARSNTDCCAISPHAAACISRWNSDAAAAATRAPRATAQRSSCSAPRPMPLWWVSAAELVALKQRGERGRSIGSRSASTAIRDVARSVLSTSPLSAGDLVRLDRAARGIGRSAENRTICGHGSQECSCRLPLRRAAGDDPSSGLDMQLRREAKSRGKAIVGFRVSRRPDPSCLAGFSGSWASSPFCARHSTLIYDEAPTQLAALTRAWSAG